MILENELWFTLNWKKSFICQFISDIGYLLFSKKKYRKIYRRCNAM